MYAVKNLQPFPQFIRTYFLVLHVNICNKFASKTVCSVFVRNYRLYRVNLYADIDQGYKVVRELFSLN